MEILSLLGRRWPRALCWIIFSLILSSSPVPLSASSSHIYKDLAGRPLKIQFLYPEGWSKSDRRAAIVFFYNGGWGKGEPQRQFDEQAEYFTARGLVTARADYRVKTRQGFETPRDCIEDIFSAMRWLRRNASSLGIDPGRIVAGGGSGSGHLLAGAFYLDEIGASGEDSAISPLPSAMLVYHPDLDDLEPEMHYRMRTDRRRARGVPPAIVLIGAEDPIFPMAAELVDRLKRLGAPVQLYSGQDGIHGFYRFSPWLEATTTHADEWLQSMGYLSPAPQVSPPALAQPASYGKRTAENVARWLVRHETKEKERAAWLAQHQAGDEASRWGSDPPVLYVYKSVEGQRLKLQVHRPPEWSVLYRRPAMIVFEGGGFSPPEPGDERPQRPSEVAPGHGFLPQAEYFAARGMVVFRVGYRKRKRDGVMPESAVADAADAMRWILDNAGTQGVDPARVVAAGGSAGGQLAASLYALAHLREPAESPAGSVRPSALLLYYPLLNWLEGDRMSETFLAALGGDRQRAARLSPGLRWEQDAPPTLILIGSRDPMFAYLTDFVSSWQSRGARMEIFAGDGGGHGFSNFSPWLEKTTQRADEWLRSLGYLGDEPRVALPVRQKGE